MLQGRAQVTRQVEQPLLAGEHRCYTSAGRNRQSLFPLQKLNSTQWGRQQSKLNTSKKSLRKWHIAAIPNISSYVMSINTDSSAGKAVASRLGLNKKTRHAQLRYVYMQDIIQRGEMTITKLPTTDNPADALTKHSTINNNHITS
eukprot:6490617-Amphidinium_carterae.1